MNLPITMPAPPIALAAVRFPTDRFRCEPYACVISAQACLKRQAHEKAQPHSSPFCVGCVSGATVHAALTASGSDIPPPPESTTQQRGTRRSAQPAGKRPKTCAECGRQGHNRRGCPGIGAPLPEKRSMPRKQRPKSEPTKLLASPPPRSALVRLPPVKPEPAVASDVKPARETSTTNDDRATTALNLISDARAKAVAIEADLVAEEAHLVERLSVVRRALADVRVLIPKRHDGLTDVGPRASVQGAILARLRAAPEPVLSDDLIGIAGAGRDTTRGALRQLFLKGLVRKVQGRKGELRWEATK